MFEAPSQSIGLRLGLPLQDAPAGVRRLSPLRQSFARCLLRNLLLPTVEVPDLDALAPTLGTLQQSCKRTEDP